MNPGYVIAALPLTNQLRESHEATLDDIWGRKEMPGPLLVLPHSTGEAVYCILHCHSSDPRESSGGGRKKGIKREEWSGNVL